MPSSQEFSGASAPIPMPEPGQNPIAWAMQNPGALQRLIEMHNQMQNFEINVVVGGQTVRAPLQRTPGGGNAVITIQLPTL